MPLDVLVKEATGLSDKYVEMALVYIRFLQDQAEKEPQKEEAGRVMQTAKIKPAVQCT